MKYSAFAKIMVVILVATVSAQVSGAEKPKPIINAIMKVKKQKNLQEKCFLVRIKKDANNYVQLTQGTQYTQCWSLKTEWWWVTDVYSQEGKSPLDWRIDIPKTLYSLGQSDEKFVSYYFPMILPEQLVRDIVNKGDEGLKIEHKKYDIILSIDELKEGKDAWWKSRLSLAFVPFLAAVGIGIWAYKNQPNRLSEFVSGLWKSGSSLVEKYLSKK